VDTPPATSSFKRAAATAVNARSKRRKLRDEPDHDLLTISEPPVAFDTFPEWSSSASQKWRLNRGYANRKHLHKPELVVGEEMVTDVKESGFMTYGEVKGAKVRVSTDEFKPLSPVRGNTRTQVKKETMKILDVADLKPSKPVEGEFRMPDLPDFASSSTTLATEITSIFDDRNHRERSESISSLSSALSLSPPSQDFVEKPVVRVRCPVCRKPVTDTARVFVPDNLRLLSLREQQTFCSEHQLAEAKDYWDERSFPDIDWDHLEASRIPEKLPLLKETILRQRPSFYLDQLDTKIEEARGNRRKIRVYLNEGIVDVARPGYYGPKGTRIMVNAITESLTEPLSKALRTDPATREAGVGAYISAVLLPELTLMLVMEDMDLKDEADGRKVLEDSTHVGVLLHPDDDHIERAEDDQ
jgi:hypothetical protein